MSAHASTRDVLLAAIEIIFCAWTSGAVARDASGRNVHATSTDAKEWCALGAILKSGVERGLDDARAEHQFEDVFCNGWGAALLQPLDVLARRRGYPDFIEANDVGGRRVAVSILREAIREIERDPMAALNERLERSAPRFGRPITREDALAVIGGDGRGNRAPEK